ncbi:Crp/Fnr family transcriptional regulator [Labilibaculum sp. K2S]|uniref:Crp/Fnr family transcriptional regulator n=1 Tax=Labilibaculum sp. K2S TaxID=3056386 RepID=UPI0025A4290F|nr:Crp/Fnr family transcriptional regulator [Labilibaculum sp. K2S]MDM8159611.1 Crp/Fnr family transcriptional regulator [Labilibaculum sp. K2S]
MSILKEHLKLDGIAEMKQFFLENGTAKKYTKNKFFIRQGLKNDSIGFVLDGGFKYLGYTSDGKEQIVGYCFENDFVVDYATFQIEKPPVIDVVAIKNSTILLLTHNDFNAFYENCGIINFRSKVAETLLNDISSRLLSLYCDSPEERYTKLINRYPDILNLISLKEIASLIKITPETLSRIRRKLSLHQNP